MGDRDRGADGAAKAGDAASAESLGMLDLAGETVERVVKRLVSVATTTLDTRASQVSNRKLHTVAAEMVAEHERERGASA